MSLHDHGAAVAEPVVAPSKRSARSALPATAIRIVLAGARGRVASALRAQLARELPSLRERIGLGLHLGGAFDRRGSVFEDAGIEPLALDQRLLHAAPPTIDQLLARLHAASTPTLLVDATGSSEWAAEYPHLLRAGIGIVTANKRAHSGSYRDWLALQQAARAGNVPLRYETTVGAALPVIGTLQCLRRRGERVLALEGVLSGSLSFVLERVQQGTRLSEALAEAIALGYTEPDPLEDLAFVDLHRKLVILAREAGQRLEPEQVRIDSLLPPGGSLAGLLAGHCDARWAERADIARRDDRRLVAVASWQLAGQARIEVRAEPAASPLARLAGGENLVRIRSEYHDALPITITGPGAGPAATAAGLLGDIIAACREWRPRD
jgi:homoserine dehydrogenase